VSHDGATSEDAYQPLALRARTARALRARGARAVAGDYARFFSGVAAGLPWTLAGSHGSFAFRGERYRYLYHRYKHTWLTERAVEVPIAKAIVDRHSAARVLEVGNVLSHYGEYTHLVVDKYERAPGVLNRDVLDLKDLGPFDLVVAISTLEHVGRDEQPRDPDLAPEAVRRLEALLAPGGRLMVTVPVGYHPGLDDAFRSGAFPSARLWAMRRGSLGPHWQERHPDEVWGSPYDFLLYSARAVLLAEIERPAG
jgi:SAM-dependent methyltransferase